MPARVAEQRWLAWQTVDTGRLVLQTVTATLVVIALARTAVDQVQHGTAVAIAFGLYIAFGELLRLALPGGREAAPIAMSAALSYAMVLTVAAPHHQPAVGNAPPLLVVLVAAGGMVLGSLPHIAAGRRAGVTGMSARLIAVACVAFIFHPLAAHLIHLPWAAFATMAVLATFGWLIETVISAIIRADDLRARYSVTLSDELGVQWRLGLAVGMSAIITVFGAEVMGLTELAVFAGPLVVIEFGASWPGWFDPNEHGDMAVVAQHYQGHPGSLVTQVGSRVARLESRGWRLEAMVLVSNGRTEPDDSAARAVLARGRI